MKLHANSIDNGGCGSSVVGVLSGLTSEQTQQQRRLLPVVGRDAEIELCVLEIVE